VVSGELLTQITAGISFAYALDTAGDAYCWGKGYSDVLVAVDTSGALAGKTLTQITAGADHEYALDTAGAACCWADHTAGELGNGSHATVPQPPVAVDTSGVLAGKTLTQISAGWQSTASWTAQSAVLLGQPGRRARHRTVSERLGHASITVTLAVYGHVMPGDQKRAADRFAALIREA
jgi:alpha-tubulin suppressor-like RCC1 family protein